MNECKIPVGRSHFADIRKNGYYFIDKSGLIEELLKTDATQVTLITRPRRFGKTLNMSMLAEFFDIQKDSRPLFAGLLVANNHELCRHWMNQYPTLFLSFKSVDGLQFSDAYAQLASVMAELHKKHFYLLEDARINPIDKELFYKVAAEKANPKEVKNSLLKLTQLMALHYQKPVILLMDEYDVPLAKASEKKYYPEMLDLIKGLLQAIKDNDSLAFAVVTGCLRIAKESIFTGTNNFVSDTISDTRLNEYFGFTQAETEQLLLDTNLTDHAAEIREWYDGYHFGDFDVYCPWDVMNHIRNLILNPSSTPGNFWENTSDNAIIRSFLDRSSFNINEKFETLLAGDSITEVITENLTYDVLKSSEENLWTLLYLTGYLTKTRPAKAAAALFPGRLALKIPNREIMDIFKKTVKRWLAERAVTSNRQDFFTALWDGDAEKLTEILSNLLFDTISYHDYRESFYHAFLTGLVSNAGFIVKSNYESGLGRSDLVIKDRKGRRAILLEAKWTDSEANLEKACHDALEQISEKQYAKSIERSGFHKVVVLAVAFWQKKCLVKRLPPDAVSTLHA